MYKGEAINSKTLFDTIIIKRKIHPFELAGAGEPTNWFWIILFYLRKKELDFFTLVSPIDPLTFRSDDERNNNESFGLVFAQRLNFITFLVWISHIVSHFSDTMEGESK